MEARDPYRKLLQEICTFAVGNLTARRDVFAPPTTEEAAFDHSLDDTVQELAGQISHEQRRQLWDIVGQYQQLRQISEWKGFKAGAALALQLVGKASPELLTKLANTDIIALLQTR